MEGTRLSAAELVRVIEEAGLSLGWSRSYQSILATSVGVAFRTSDLDEEADQIAVDPAAIEELANQIAETSIALGHAPRTAAAYAASWRRLATIASKWKLGGGEDPNNRFWETTPDLGDKRTRRLGKTDTTSWRLERPAETEPESDSTETIVVELASGRASVLLPKATTSDELLEVARAVLGFQPHTPEERH
jgi:hypothetical protein